MGGSGLIVIGGGFILGGCGWWWWVMEGLFWVVVGGGMVYHNLIIIILICQTLHLSIIIPFNILKFSSNKKLEKEKLNKKSSLFKKYLELHLLLGFL